jgi:hypothetical protein
MTVEVILRMRWVPVSRAVAKRADGFIRYVQFRDHHRESEPASDVDDLIRYIKHRDVTRPGGRLFDDAGPAGEEQRTRLVQFIDRSSAATLDAGGPRSSTDDHGYYQIIISPKDAPGLDLRAMTRATMRQLARDAGTGGIPLWIAGEHRNTRHPHVHIVLAAKREVASGHFRTLLVTNQRRERMQTALNDEMARQREVRAHRQHAALRAAEAARVAPLHAIGISDLPQSQGRKPDQRSLVEALAWSRLADRSPRMSRTIRGLPTAHIAQLAGRLARHHLRQAEREARRRRYRDEDDESRRQRKR